METETEKTELKAETEELSPEEQKKLQDKASARVGHTTALQKLSEKIDFYGRINLVCFVISYVLIFLAGRYSTNFSSEYVETVIFLGIAVILAVVQGHIDVDSFKKVIEYTQTITSRVKK